MKKIIKSRIFLVILTAIIVSSVTVYAVNNWNASEIDFTPTNPNWNVNKVDKALDELYNKSNHNIIFIPESDSGNNAVRSSFSVSSGVKKIYLLYSNSTNVNSLVLNISGENVISTEQVAHNSAVDNYGYTLRSSLTIYEVSLTGDEGTINLSVSGGSGDRRAWTAIAMY